MVTNENLEKIVDELKWRYPDTHCFLNYNKDYELLFAVILSAQATDKSVNEATEKLFVSYPRLEDYVPENQEGIYRCIRKVGLAKNKCGFLLKTAAILLSCYDGKVPKDRSSLMELPGVGYKTSGVVLAELYDEAYIPVDTHVYRVSHRLGIVKNDLSLEETETALEKKFRKFHSIEIHRQLILFGRNICKANRPECDVCPFVSFCRYFRNSGKGTDNGKRP